VCNNNNRKTDREAAMRQLTMTVMALAATVVAAQAESPTALSAFVCWIAMLPSAMVIETPSASTRMLTTPLLPIVPPWLVAGI
jgi:hypothetical protein